jgi:hypothetical protein
VVGFNDGARAKTRALALLLGLGLVVGSLVTTGCSACSTPKSTTSSAGSAETSASDNLTATPSATETGATTTSEPAATSDSPKSTSSSKESADANDVKHQATYIVETGKTSSGGNTITFDYVQFLTGDAAEKAAKAHGQEAENDYFVVNDNPKLRTFPVSSSAVIKLHPAEDPSFTRDFSFSELKTLIAAGSKTYGGKHYYWMSEATYYVNVEDGKVTRVENQWVP